MTAPRVFDSAQWFKPAPEEPLRTVVSATAQAVVVAWHVAPGQRIVPHVHPAGQDTWVVLAGAGLYQLDAAGRTQRIGQGDIVVAQTGAVHGVFNDGATALQFVSVVSPDGAGYEPL